MKKDTRFQRKYSSNDKVTIGSDERIWTVCREAKSDGSKHVHYKLSRGAWKKYVRGDLMKMA